VCPYHRKDFTDGVPKGSGGKRLRDKISFAEKWFDEFCEVNAAGENLKQVGELNGLVRTEHDASHYERPNECPTSLCSAGGPSSPDPHRLLSANRILSFATKK